jgi:signal transduction histidine kinase
MKLPKMLDQLRKLEELRSSAEEHALLNQVRTRVRRIESEYRADEELFDEAFGPIGDVTLLAGDPERLRPARERLWRQEELIRKHLSNLGVELKLRSEQAGLRLEREQDRAVWATLLLAVIALGVGVGVMLIATRTLRPLRTLADRAKEVARGDYKQRVDATSPDEIGALGREFNAMAAALDEREQRLIRSERLAAVGKIAAQITHEVRNPLSSIGLNAEMLEEETAGEARKLARAIVKEVDRLTEITEEYLRFARLPRPKLDREDLGELLRSLVAFMHQELEGRGVTVDARIDPALPPVAADEHQLRQALLNLLRNAVEAMRAGGRLTLTAGRVAPSSNDGDDGRYVELTIADTGEGIAPDHLPKIFDPFFSTKEGGTGLGLALTQQIIVEHGGKIEVRSAPGQGTTFVIRLVAAASSPVHTTVGARVA